MQFKNWPFKKDEKVVLYWMTSPRKNESGWVMDAVFKRQSGFSPRILRVEVPWGTLPYLRIGRTYYSGDNWLVQEIISVDGFDIPFEEVSYSHPLLEMMRFEDEGENTSRTKPKMIGIGQEDEMNNLGGMAKATSVQPRVIVPAIEFMAKKKIKIKHVFRHNRPAKRNRGDGQTKNWCPTNKVTTQDCRHGGFLRPIEVRGISFVDFDKMSMENQNGLKEFVDSINVLSEQQPAWNLDIKFVLVPEEIRISKYPSGERRMCAVVKIERVAKGPIWLVELARPDQWKISTLLLGGSSLESPMEDLKKWLSTDGHWNICALKEALFPSIQMIRHTNSGINFRREKLKQKIRMID